MEISPGIEHIQVDNTRGRWFARVTFNDRTFVETKLDGMNVTPVSNGAVIVSFDCATRDTPGVRERMDIIEDSANMLEDCALALELGGANTPRIVETRAKLKAQAVALRAISI